MSNKRNWSWNSGFRFGRHYKLANMAVACNYVYDTCIRGVGDSVLVLRRRRQEMWSFDTAVGEYPD